MSFKVGDLVKVVPSRSIGIVLHRGEVTACHSDGTYDIGMYTGWREFNLDLVRSATIPQVPAQDYLDLFI